MEETVLPTCCRRVRCSWVLTPAGGIRDRFPQRHGLTRTTVPWSFSSPVIAIDEPGADIARYPPEVVAQMRKTESAKTMLQPPEMEINLFQPSWCETTFNTSMGSLAAAARR